MAIGPNEVIYNVISGSVGGCFYALSLVAKAKTFGLRVTSNGEITFGEIVTV